VNFAYLYINEYENLQDKIDFFEQLKKSTEFLKRHTVNPVIYVYHSSNDTEIKEYCMSNGYIAKPISYHRPFTGLIKILVEKIFILKDFSDDEEVVLLDVDTVFKQYVDDNTWGSIPILWSAEYYITQFRNLDKILPSLPWYEIDINFDTSYIMYNTGVVYIPKKERKEICRKALWITDRLNDGKDPEFRYGNKLDEQIGLSIAICDRYLYKEGIFISNQIIDHFWESKAKGEKWWEQIG
jgi:hypothetical protein